MSKFRDFFDAAKLREGEPDKMESARPSRIKVVGVGGGGTNAVNRMIEAGLSGVEFLAMNTDVQVLSNSQAHQTLHLGEDSTRGLGAGGNPEVGRSAAEESKREIKKMLEGCDMVFITAGMGGGTGTGAAPMVAEIARNMGLLTVAVVTKPFGFEGPRRMRLADEGIANLRQKVDTIIIVPNDKLLSADNRRMKLNEAFKLADDVLRQGVQGISDIITIPGMINVDFADVRAIMSNAGAALLGIGTGAGGRRAEEAAQRAVSSPLLETSIEGATRVLVNITSGLDLTLDEYTEAAQQITDLCDQKTANIIFGWVLDENMLDEVRVTVLATGFGSQEGPAVPQAAKSMIPNSQGITTLPPVVADPPKSSLTSHSPASNNGLEQNNPLEAAVDDRNLSRYQSAPRHEDELDKPDSARPGEEKKKPVYTDLEVPAFLRERAKSKL